MSAQSAKALADKQRHYDRLHHQMRLAWLESELPVWGDGTPVPSSVIHQLSNQSRAAIREPETGVRSVNLSDADYLIELDAFAKEAP